MKDKSIHLENDVYLLEVNNPQDLEINITKNSNTKLVITGFNNYHLKINVLENANITVNSINKNNSKTIRRK